VDSDAQRRDFRTVATTLGSDPDLALARAQQIEREQEGLAAAAAYLLVLAELCEGRV
jgi:hypothetical protein